MLLQFKITFVFEFPLLIFNVTLHRKSLQYADLMLKKYFLLSVLKFALLNIFVKTDTFVSEQHLFEICYPMYKV